MKVVSHLIEAWISCLLSTFDILGFCSMQPPFSPPLRLSDITINHDIRRMRTHNEHYCARCITGLYPPVPAPLCAAFKAS